LDGIRGMADCWTGDLFHVWQQAQFGRDSVVRSTS
jgi:hypothetical protein